MEYTIYIFLKANKKSRHTHIVKQIAKELKFKHKNPKGLAKWFVKSHDIYQILGLKPLARILESSDGILPCYTYCVWDNGTAYT